MKSTSEINDLVAVARGKGMLARLAACELAAHYRQVLGFSELKGAQHV